MLYNGALKFIKLTKMEIAEKRYNTAHEYNIRVQDIIRELMLTLDHQYPVAEQMNRLYEYLHKRLIEANVKKILQFWMKLKTLSPNFGMHGSKQSY